MAEFLLPCPLCGSQPTTTRKTIGHGSTAKVVTCCQIECEEDYAGDRTAEQNWNETIKKFTQRNQGPA